MKKIFLSLFALVALVSMVCAQDNIVLKTGEEIKAKVEEVGLKEIKYKRTDNPTGPLYTISKNDVLLINYQNGTKDVFAAEKSKQVEPANPETQPADYNRLRHLGVKKIAGGAVMIGVGAPVLLTGVGLTIGGLVNLSEPVYYTNGNGFTTRDNGAAPLLGLGALFTAAGIALEIAGPITLKKGLKLRRQAKAAMGGTLGFTPIRDANLDRYSRAMNQNKIGTLSFTF